MSEQPDKCRKRFKGVENFLRRIAFNLGNTPSQTEVKIISCIPIDVTDLQQKIIYLEKQLEEDKSQAQPAAEATAAPPDATEQAKKGRQASVHTAIGTPTFLRSPKIVRSCKGVDYQISQPCPEDSNRKSSVISFIYPTYADSKEYITLSRERIAPEMYDDCYNEMNESRMTGQKKKKFSNKKKVKTHLVYYTQTDNNPFKKYIPSLKPIKDNEILSRSYLSSMVRKQYKPSFVGGFSDDFSHFTAPICRDTDSNDNEFRSYESDMCSCCHGAFHNIDTHITKKNNVPSPLVTNTVIENNHRNAYYDSSLYDLVPVKENPCKINRDPEVKRKRNKHQENPKHCPDYMRTKSGVNPLIVNYQTMGPNYLKKKQMKIHNRRRDVIVNRARKQRFKNKFDRESSINSSKSCCLDLGEIYIKPTKNKTRTPKKREPRHKNAECLTTSITMIECQTATSNSIEPPPTEDKTEVTLNQIKAILQSVLTEVKTNNQPKDTTAVKDKRDAVVQKGISQSNAQGASSLLNSFTYSPYNMNPYTASCSRNSPPPNQYYYNGYNGSFHPKCLQNYPLFIQTPGRHVCASCYRNSSHVAKQGNPKYATTAGTNTGEICAERSKETEKLIKEIYKSMALTMDLAAKDTSLSEYDDLKSTYKDSTEKCIGNSNNPKVVKEPEAISEQIRKKYNQPRQFASQINAKSKIKTPSSPASRQSRELSTDTVMSNHRARKEVIEKYINTRNKEILQSTETEYEAQDLQQGTMTSISDDETETTGSETDSDVTYVPAKDRAVKKEKKGLFSKFKSVFKSKEKKKKPESEEEESEVSDSDDYQTIYSQKVQRTPNRRVANTPRKIKPHSKVMHSKQFHQRERKAEKSKRTPYMEQEYRRYWNEKLMFHENQNRKYSSEQPYSREINPHYSPRTEYYRNYEARHALVEPNGLIYQPKLGMINARHPQPKIDKPQLKVLPTNINGVPKAPNATGKGLSWLKNHKTDIRCGQQWKKMLLES